MKVSAFYEYKDKFKKVAEESGISLICAMRNSVHVLYIKDYDKIDIVSKLLRKYIPEVQFAVIVPSKADMKNADILVYKSGEKYVWYETEWDPDDFDIPMSKTERALYARYGLV